MTTIEALRKEIINHAWINPNVDMKRSPEFFKWLEIRLRYDRQELLSEIKEELSKCDSYMDCMEAINKFKIR